MIRGAVTVFLGLAVASMSAQTQSAAAGGTSYIETSKFIGKKVKSSQGDEIGTVKDIVLDRSTGCLAYTVVSTTGGGGARASGGGKMVAVPWGVYSPASDLNVLTVTVDRDRIYNAPVFDYARIEEYSRPEYITNVYSYYGVNAGGAVGVGVSGSTTTTGTTTTGQTTSNTAAGTSARTSAGASPAGAASPAATASQGANATATPRGTPGGRTHPTASPDTRGEERPTPSTRKTRGERGKSEESPAPRDREPGSRSESEPSRPEGSGQGESDAGTRQSHSNAGQARADESPSGEKTTTRHRAKTGKRESSSPAEQPEQH